MHSSQAPSGVLFWLTKSCSTTPLLFHVSLKRTTSAHPRCPPGECGRIDSGLLFQKNSTHSSSSRCSRHTNTLPNADSAFSCPRGFSFGAKKSLLPLGCLTVLFLFFLSSPSVDLLIRNLMIITRAHISSLCQTHTAARPRPDARALLTRTSMHFSLRSPITGHIRQLL